MNSIRIAGDILSICGELAAEVKKTPETSLVSARDLQVQTQLTDRELAVGALVSQRKFEGWTVDSIKALDGEVDDLYTHVNAIERAGTKAAANAEIRFAKLEAQIAALSPKGKLGK